MRFDYLTYIVRKFNAFLLVLFIAFIPFTQFKKIHLDASHDADQTNYPFVFVHGFQGWGEDVKGYQGLPYWGLLNGDALKAYREAGFTCVAPTLDPVGSVWDRACELYAKLKGTRVDYGEAHSASCGHDRYGEDYTGRGMLEAWDDTHKINLLGHSLGGPTCTMLTSVLANGAEAEIEATKDGSISEYFTGGKAGWVHSVTGLASVYNGTSLFVNEQAVHDTAAYLKTRLNEKTLPGPAGTAILSRMIDGISAVLEDMTSGEIADTDTAIYDMQPDNTLELNKSIKTVASVYYLSVIQDATMPSKIDGHLIADPSVSDPLLLAFVPIIARTSMITPGGLEMGEAWAANDGCANTISQKAPFGEPMTELTEEPSPALGATLQPGVYNVLPVFRATHVAITGDVLKPNLKGPTYLLRVMEMINAMPA